MPTVRNESVNLSIFPKRRALEEIRVRRVFCHLLFADLVERDVPQHLIRGPLDLGDLYAESGQTLQRSLSAVIEANFARKYAMESSRRDLHNALFCTALQSQFFVKNVALLLLKFANLGRFLKILAIVR